jgi:hypothetical protein
MAAHPRNMTWWFIEVHSSPVIYCARFEGNSNSFCAARQITLCWLLIELFQRLRHNTPTGLYVTSLFQGLESLAAVFWETIQSTVQYKAKEKSWLSFQLSADMHWVFPALIRLEWMLWMVDPRITQPRGTVVSDRRPRKHLILIAALLCWPARGRMPGLRTPRRCKPHTNKQHMYKTVWATIVWISPVVLAESIVKYPNRYFLRPFLIAMFSSWGR